MIDTNKLLEELMQNFSTIKESDIPAINLYMDQVTTFMDTHLTGRKRFDDDKILTKTMINNYAKNDLLPSPEKKRYSKQHMIMLIFIYYFKNMLSINDIKTILEPISKEYFDNTGNISLEDIYTQINDSEATHFERTFQDIKDKIAESSETFVDLPEDDRSTLQLFSLILSLCFDIYLKKQMLESIVDSMNTEQTEKAAAEKTMEKNVKEKKHK